jgi:hypothetical protein
MNRWKCRMGLVGAWLVATSGFARAAEVTIAPLPGVANSSQITKAFEFAKEKNKTIVIVMTQQTVNVIACPSCAGKKIVGLSYGFMAAREFQGMMRILAFPGGDKPAEFTKVIDQVPADERGSYPQVYIADPQTHKLLGFASRDTPWAERVRIFGLVKDIAGWRTKTDRSLEQVQKLIQSGAFTSAIRRVVKIMKKDGQITKLMAGTQNTILIPTASDAAAPTPGRFYGDLYGQTKTSILARATEMVAEAQKLKAQGKLAEAQALFDRLNGEGRNLIAGNHMATAGDLLALVIHGGAPKATVATAEALTASIEKKMKLAELKKKASAT